MVGTAFTSATFIVFFVASLLLAIAPGPGVVYIVTQTLSQGRRAGLASVGGIALGNLGNALAASAGLAAVFAASSTAFVAVKLAGAAYLLFLGIKALRTRSTTAAATGSNRISPMTLFRNGFIVALLNPKTAMFFAALLPQFMSPNASALGQSCVFGCEFVLIALCTDTIYVLTASVLASKLRHRVGSRPYGRYISAATFIGLGVYAALASPRGTIPK